MRIAVDATPAAVQRAGVGRYARELIRALVELPEDDRYLLTAAAGRDEREQLLDALPPGAWREARGLPLRERWMTALWQRARVPLPVESLIGPFDVFHGTDFVTPPSRRPCVVTVHDLSYLLHPEYAEPSLAAYLRRAVPASLDAAAAVIAVSASVAAELATAYPTVRSRLVAIPNGVRLPAAPCERAPEPRPIVLTIGTIEPRKDLATLLRAIEIVREWRPDALLMVAGRVGWRADVIVGRLRAAEARGAVCWVEAPSDAELERLYARATVFASASRYEGFGLPVLEAQARGLPVVASDIPALRETGGDVACYAAPGDPEAFASTLCALFDDIAERERLGAFGAERAQRFSWRATATATRRVYARAASR